MSKRCWGVALLVAAAGSGCAPEPLPPPRAPTEGHAQAEPEQFSPQELADWPAPYRDQLRKAHGELERGQAAQARQRFEELLAAEPGLAAAHFGLLLVDWRERPVGSEFGGGVEPEQGQRLQERLDQIHRLQPGHARAWFYHAQLLLAEGDALGAESALRHAESLSDEAGWLSAMGVVHLAQGRKSEARDAFRSASQLEPNNAQVLANYAAALMMLEQVGEAVVLLERAVQLEPKSSRILADLGTALLTQGQAERALGFLRRAHTQAPEKATIMNNLGYAQQQLGQRESARRWYDLAVQQDPKLGSAWINLGIWLAQEGKLPEARQALGRAAELDPTDPRVQANLRDLDALSAPAPRAGGER